MKKMFFTIASVVMLLVTACNPDEGGNAVKFSVDQNKIEAPASGGVYQIAVTSASASRAVVTYNGAEEDWIQLLPATLKSSGKIQVTIGAYDNPLEARTAVITIASGSESIEVQVMQKPADTITLDRSSLVTIDEARSYAVKVSSTAAWTATKSAGADWLTITESGATGETELVVTTTATPDYATKREAEITVTSGTLEAKLKVTQGYGVLINGIIWGKYDVGRPGQFCESVEDIPSVYQYNSNVPCSIPSACGPDTTIPEGFSWEPYNGTDTWADENNPCPDGWRIPTAEEFAALVGGTYNAAADTFVEQTKKYAYRWYYNTVGVFIGNENCDTASKDDMKGNIFMTRVSYREHTGIMPEDWRVWRQTVTRPASHNWSRACYVFAGNPGESATYGSGVGFFDNPAAFAIRPVADLAPSAVVE